MFTFTVTYMDKKRNLVTNRGFNELSDAIEFIQSLPKDTFISLIKRQNKP